jgi:ABC-2 type transport system ATP-binding protein
MTVRWPKVLSIILFALALAACGGSQTGTSVQDSTTKTAAVLTLVDGLLSDITQTSLEPLSDSTQEVGVGRFDASTVSFDGTVVAFTVYTPNIPVGNSAPLLLEGHGWGGKRTRDLDTTDFANAANTPLQTAKLGLTSGMQGGKHAARGWYVISFDQRGFGESGGLANVMDPRIEGQDVKAIIDWAQANLTRLAYRKNKSGIKDPVIGAVGLSYGGGYQLIGAGVDKRIDALVPTTTWHDLRYSLYSEVPKSEYLSILVGVGTAGLGRAEPFIYQAFVDANTTGKVSDDFSRRMYQHSAISYCEGANPDMTQPGIPAFFIQAGTDILFNLTEGYQAFECYRKSNSGSKFMAVRYGHPDAIYGGSMPKFTEENIDCGGAAGSKSLSVARLAFSFLSQNLVDAKLNENASSDYLTVPDLRAILEDSNASSGPKGEAADRACYEVAKLPATSGSTLFKRGGELYPSDGVGTIAHLTVGVPAPLTTLVQNDPTLVQPALMAAFATPDAGQVLPLIGPVGRVRSLVGIAKVHVNVKPTLASPLDSANPPIIFIGLARKTADGKQQLIHNQIMPVKGFGERDVDLPGLSVLLHADDSLGLVVFGFHPQYFNSYTRIPVEVQITDIRAALPFVS